MRKRYSNGILTIFNVFFRTFFRFENRRTGMKFREKGGRTTAAGRKRGPKVGDPSGIRAPLKRGVPHYPVSEIKKGHPETKTGKFPGFRGM